MPDIKPGYWMTRDGYVAVVVMRHGAGWCGLIFYPDLEDPCLKFWEFDGCFGTRHQHNDDLLHPHPDYPQPVDDKDREIEILRADYHKWEERAGGYAEELDDAHVEIARLQAIIDATPNWPTEPGTYDVKRVWSDPSGRCRVTDSWTVTVPEPEPDAPSVSAETWAAIPAWHDWVAMTDDGDWSSFENEPMPVDGRWLRGGGWHFIPPEYAPTWEGDWKQSKVKRPEDTQ